MQKIFRKYTVFIMTAAIFSILIVNFVITMYWFQKQQLATFSNKIDQVIHTMENNQEELATIKSNLDEDYLTRAKAAAYVLERNQEVLKSVPELKNLAKLLDVDEIHIIDGDGILIYSSVPKYIGLDFHDGEQTVEFLSILDSEDENVYVIQEAQPNAAEGKIMKYVGVARKGEKGVVQVGLEPIRQLEAQEKNTYEYIFSRFPTEKGEVLFAIDYKTGEVLGHAGNVTSGKLNSHYQIEELESCESGKFREMNESGQRCYVVTRKYGDILIGALLPERVMFANIWMNMATMFLCLLLIELLTVVLLDFLVKRNVVDGIHGILEKLTDITNGNLDTRLEIGGNPEFEKLSGGINGMVKSIVTTSDRISKIIEMSEIPLAAFEYQKDMKCVFVTSGLGELLGVAPETMGRLCERPKHFYDRIQDIMKRTVEDEKDIYRIDNDKYVRIHLSVENDDYLGVITNATEDILAKQKMQYENNHDQLTGLLRYRYFKKQIPEKAKTEGSCACVMMDLDNFKSVNDTYGHDAGDKYLISFADMMRELPENHCLPTRRSGDEFCVFIFGYETRNEIRALLDSFWQLLKQRGVMLGENAERFITVSGGIAFAEGEVNVQLLLEQADHALYQAKRKNKGHYEEYVQEKAEF